MSAAQTPAVITVVVADDQTVVREGLRAMLGFLPGIDVVATAPSAEDALEAVSRLDPDVLLTDLRMPGIGGVEGIRRLRASGARTAAVALTTYDDDATVREALGAGALGFLNKDAEPEAVADALRAAAAGRSLLDARVVAAPLGGPVTPREPGTSAPTSAPAGSGGLAAGSPDRRGAGEPPAPRPDGLTERELDVLRLVASGRANGDIARELYVSPSTVKTHINHLFAKTGVISRADLVRYAYEHGLTA